MGGISREEFDELSKRIERLEEKFDTMQTIIKKVIEKLQK